MSAGSQGDDQKPHRGGARAGAGRKAQTGDGGPLRRCTVNLDEASIAILTAYGDGELSEGIRRAARAEHIKANQPAHD